MQLEAQKSIYIRGCGRIAVCAFLLLLQMSCSVLVPGNQPELCSIFIYEGYQECEHVEIEINRQLIPAEVVVAQDEFGVLGYDLVVRGNGRNASVYELESKGVEHRLCKLDTWNLDSCTIAVRTEKSQITYITSFRHGRYITFSIGNSSHSVVEHYFPPALD